MLVQQLFERGHRPETVSVPIHREVEVSPGEWDEVTLNAVFSYTVERDPFGTGDSPTEYNMELVGLTGPDGQQLSVDMLSDEEYERAELQAHELL